VGAFWSYVRAFRTHWLTAMSGGFSVPFTALAVFAGNKYQQAIFGFLAFAAFWFAGFRVWKFEHDKVLLLEQKVGPPPRPLKVEIGQEGPFVSAKAAGLHGIKRTYNLRIVNRHQSKPITNCKVTILEVTPDPMNKKMPWILTDIFSLASGEDIYVPLASFGEASEPEKYPCADTLVQVHSPVGDNWFLIETTEHLLKIRATSHDSGYCDVSCKPWVDASGKFQIAEV
jgi:hypothetical protein